MSTTYQMMNYCRLLLIEELKRDEYTLDDMKQIYNFVHDILSKRIDNNDTIKQFIKSHKHTTERFDYLLVRDISNLDNELKQSTVEYLLANGWVADKNLGDKRTLRGYKLKH